MTKWTACFRPWTLLHDYRALFEEWKTFYKALDDRQKPAYKDQATRAIEGMTVSDVTTRVAELDKRYKALCEPSPSVHVDEQANRINQAFDTTRDQVAVLAKAFTKAHSDLAAAEVSSAAHGEFLKLVGQPRELQVYLAATFPMTWKTLSDGRPLVQIVIQILGQLKDGRVVN